MVSSGSSNINIKKKQADKGTENERGHFRCICIYCQIFIDVTRGHDTQNKDFWIYSEEDGKLLSGFDQGSDKAPLKF